MLDARDVPASDGRLTAEVTGEIGPRDGVLVIHRIEVVYRLRAAEEHHETARRAHELHAEFCPVARTLGGCVEIGTRLEIESP